MAVKRKVKRTSELEEISLKEAFDEFYIKTTSWDKNR